MKGRAMRATFQQRLSIGTIGTDAGCYQQNSLPSAAKMIAWVKSIF